MELWQILPAAEGPIIPMLEIVIFVLFISGLLTCLITFNLPFTLFKGLLDAALCFLIYKPLSGVLHGRK